MNNRLYIKPATFFGTLVALTSSAFAQSNAPGHWPLPEGCYIRNYSADHLAKHPRQVVAKIMIKFGLWERDPTAGFQVITADQGHVLQNNQAGKYFTEGSQCDVEPWPEGLGAELGWVCPSATNLGEIYLKRFDDEVLVFQTRLFVMGESENPHGVLDLAELPNQWLTYKLFRVNETQCVDWESLVDAD